MNTTRPMTALAWRAFKRNAWIAIHTLAWIALTMGGVTWLMGFAGVTGLMDGLVLSSPDVTRAQSMGMIHTGMIVTFLALNVVILLEATKEYWR